MPEMYNLVVNTSESTSIPKQQRQRRSGKPSKKALDLAKLLKNLLKGEALTAFVKEVSS
jgi:hypothetical protein